MAVGVLTHHLLVSALASGGLAAGSEEFMAGVDADARRTVQEVVTQLGLFFVGQGWIPGSNLDWYKTTFEQRKKGESHEEISKDSCGIGYGTTSCDLHHLLRIDEFADERRGSSAANRRVSERLLQISAARAGRRGQDALVETGS
jgi:hypothetical protein